MRMISEKELASTAGGDTVYVESITSGGGGWFDVSYSNGSSVVVYDYNAFAYGTNPNIPMSYDDGFNNGNSTYGSGGQFDTNS